MIDLWDKWMRVDQRLRLAIMVAVILVQAAFIFWMQTLIREKESNRAAYIVQHDCIREGFAGRNAEPIYRCKTGLWLEHEIGKKQRQGAQ